MKEQREILKEKILETVKDFMATKGGVNKFDLQVLFGNPVDSIGCNEISAALRLNGFRVDDYDA